MNHTQNPPSHPDLRPWIEERIQLLPFCRMSDMTPTAAEPGLITLLLPARPTWCGDPVRNRIHTGCLCALADTTCGFAVGTSMTDPGVLSTLDLRMDYLRSADSGTDLVCQAQCHRLTRSVAFVSGQLRQPGSEDVIALVNATFMRSPQATRRPGGAKGTAPKPSLQAQAEALQAIRPTPPDGHSPYVDFLGVEQYAQAGAGPIFHLPFQADLIGNPLLPALHGGVLAGFGETVMLQHLVASHRPTVKGIPKAVDFSIDYLRPAKPISTYGQAVTIRLGNRVSLVQANLWQEDPLRPVATIRGHWLMPQA